MENELIYSLTATFEGHAQTTENGVEYWLARDLQHLLGYTKWDNFLNVISKAKTACEVSGHEIQDHFADVGKMVDLGSGSKREIKDGLRRRLEVAGLADCETTEREQHKKCTGVSANREQYTHS